MTVTVNIVWMLETSADKKADDCHILVHAKRILLDDYRSCMVVVFGNHLAMIKLLRDILPSEFL